MCAWFLPTISEALVTAEPVLESQIKDAGDAGTQAEREWSAAIAALTQLLQVTQHSESSVHSDTDSVDPTQPKGLVLVGPSPVLDDAASSAYLHWVFTAEPFSTSFQLPPAKGQGGVPTQNPTGLIPLVPEDPLITERFCLVITADFSLIMVLGKSSAGQSSFLFSFLPETIQKVWEVLRPRVLLTQSPQVNSLDTLVRQFTQTEPPYQVIMQFSRLLSKFLSALPQAESVSDGASRVNNPRLRRSSSAQPGMPVSPSPSAQPSHVQMQGTQPNYMRAIDGLCDLSERPDVKLLQAIAHEVRTPLATINTLIRLLLKRSDLPLEVIQRLETIHRECTEQIDRFSLIFRAAELETSEIGRPPVHLTSVSLAQVLQKSVPRWQKQAAHRNLTLHVALPQQMPAVVSDPTMLDQVLTGLIDRFTRSLIAGSHIYIQVTLAGDQLKLQLRSQPNPDDTDQPETNSTMPALKSLGQLLMLQPETGSLSLSLPVTKNLFQALGGKLTVRKQPQQGEVLTIFLPLGRESNTASQ